MTHQEIRQLLPRWAAGFDVLDVEPLLAHLATGCGECLRDSFPAVPAPLAPRPCSEAAGSARRRAVVSGALASATLVALAASGFVHLQHSRAATRAGLTQAFSRIDALEAERRDLAHELGRAGRELASLRTTLATPPVAPEVATPPPVIAVAPPPPPVAPPAPPTAPAPDPETPDAIVRYDADRLSVRLTRVLPARILEELGRQTEATVRGHVVDAPPVSARFDDVPLPEALHRLLGRQNFTLAYDGRHRLRAVTLLGGPVEPGRDERSGRPAVAAATAASAPDASRVLDWRLSIPAHGRLAWMLGERSMTLRQLARVSAETEDARARFEAIRVVLAGLQASTELRDAVHELLTKVDDATLARAAAALGDHAPETLARFTRLLGDAELRGRATAVLAALRGSGARVAADAPAGESDLD